jgi:hypothetical protein
VFCKGSWHAVEPEFISKLGGDRSMYEFGGNEGALDSKHFYSAATWAPFSATERFISSTRKASATDTAAKIRKQSK